MNAPKQWEFDHPYELINMGTYVMLRAHNVDIASFGVDSWGSLQACIEQAWAHAYGEGVVLSQAEPIVTLSQALTDLNNAAYAAAKAARADNQWVLADELRKLALRTDEIKDGKTI